MPKQNITREIDQEYGYDLEIETSFTREDGFMCAALLNGEQIDMFYGATAEADAKQRLYSEVTRQINGGAQSYAAYCEAEPTDESPYGNMPQLAATAPTSYAALVEAREAAYIAQRDAENKLNDIKATLTASIAADPTYKNDSQRKAELANRLQDYDIYVDNATKTADAYRKACNAIEVYQEAAKDQRARMRYETAQMELEAAKLHLQAVQAKQKPVVADIPHQKPDAIEEGGIVPNFETQHAWILDVWNALSTIPSGDFAGYVAKCVYQGRVCNDLIVCHEDGRVVVFENEGDCQNYCIAMRDRVGYGEWSPRKAWYERPF